MLVILVLFVEFIVVTLEVVILKKNFYDVVVTLWFPDLYPGCISHYFHLCQTLNQ